MRQNDTKGPKPPLLTPPNKEEQKTRNTKNVKISYRINPFFSAFLWPRLVGRTLPPRANVVKRQRGL
jgi:hypothetical protein